MLLSVIVPTRSRYQNLVSVLEALDNQTFARGDYEIIVSDDNSTDETQSVINKFRNKPFKYIFNSVPKSHSWNASVVRNLGALVADRSTSHFLFVDSDVVLPSTALTDYAQDISNNPDRVIIGSYDFWNDKNDKVKIPDVRSLKFQETTVDQTFETVHDGLACFGGNLVIPKSIFWSVGGFDEDVHIGLEDGSMGLKLWKKKTKFSYDNRTKGKHLWHETPGDRFPSDMKTHIDNLNLKHFHTKDPDYGIVEMSRETYAEWGINDWQPPAEWQQNQLNFMMKVNKQ